MSLLILVTRYSLTVPASIKSSCLQIVCEFSHERARYKDLDMAGYCQVMVYETFIIEDRCATVTGLEPWTADEIQIS